MAFRLGIVGCGSVSERHARAAAASPEVAIVACADTERRRAEDWARRHACEAAYGSYEELVRGHELDGVILATWPTLHRDQVLGCLELGVRAILCEKALATGGEQALEIRAAARAAGALVTEGYMYRHHPAIATIDRLLAAGEIGEVDSVHAAFSLFDAEESPPDDPARDWRRRLECGGGVPHDIACYCVDACNRFAGARPRAAQAVTGTSPRNGTIARLFGLILYENGVVGCVESSLRADANHELRISGSRGQLRLPVAWRIDHPTEVIAARSVGWDVYEERRFPAPAVDAYRLELERFAAAARGEAEPVPALEESVLTALVVDALLAGGREGAAVAVDVPDALAP
ncbi:MAG TPA: Gfo/Idh/MocA family oxidoreductase [Gaiellaceae bacterium]|nr:Gfo/Idh/MocA family oxidoreductase [Gaiellaceae bacterium]